MKYLLTYQQIRQMIPVIASILLVAQAPAQTSTVQFKSTDNVIITADMYVSKPNTAPFIVLFHQARFSRGEYLETAPKLNAMGFNCMAVDLRSGESVNGVENKTFLFADSLGLETRYVDAYDDMKAAISYARRKYPGAKLIVFGSSYTASLSIKLASDFPSIISGVVAFSPGEYFSKFGWNREITQISASNVRCPVFITSAREEKESWQKIYDAIPVQSKVSFVPQANGKHGSKALWSAFPESKEYWSALSGFLNRY